MTRSSWTRGVGLGLAVLGMLATTACLGPAPVEWGDGLTAEDRERIFEDLPPEARASFLPLSNIFYERITSRRFNSRATFEDPSVRQFFPTVASYSDYYAALADALDQAYIRYNRPTRVDLLGIDRAEDGRLRVSLRFVGRNDLPLRWWNASLLRTDVWLWEDGRWWVVPGKV